MAAQKPLVVFFKEIDKTDLPLVGGKGANLGEMTKAKFPVPNGFAVTTNSYDEFLAHNNLERSINKILQETDSNDPEQLQRSSNSIKKLILKGEFPDNVLKSTQASYKKLSGRFKPALVAVRSSATAEDLPKASFAGQQASFMNIKGDVNLLETVRECFASLFTARAIFYRNENKINHKKVKISVIVQKMVQSEVSGVMFTVDPVTSDKDRIVIEAVWGLGDMLVQGQVVPDRYVVQKDTFSVLSKKVSDQAVQLKKFGSSTKEIKVPKKNISKIKLSEKEIVSLAKIADKLQRHYYFPQDIEWAKEKNKLYIVQTRPITTIKKTSSVIVDKDASIETGPTPILSGAGASPGIGTGYVKILKSPKEIGKISKGDVLVAEMTSPDFVPAMRRASAIVTNKGGLTSHAAIVSRELGVPCVVGTKKATSILLPLRNHNSARNCRRWRSGPWVAGPLVRIPPGLRG